MEPLAWIYIMTNNHNTTLYVGATTNIRTRLWEHVTSQNPKAFTARYRPFKLVYYEAFTEVDDAFARESFIKGKSRQWKEDLITGINPTWSDLRNRFQ